ncbi:GNAT family N-acetyltransferase [Streptomyces sp. XD-27]|uniref:GNAT family N-acetyltransferase n=1 Tax=Streptomyces sp. XD-27 TaxID=3062779 RepID=UPI0026F47184|nr:GNAT family N-acetyltransferase [Streptomyces sp. XD-27]WKX71435.1 GNAT family N-acetyltransferase [Streptomyces sp. XD-27]
MSSETIIRPYRPADEEAVVDLWSRASKAAHPFIGGEGEGTRARKIREVYLVHADNWVAESAEGAVVGLLGLLEAEIGGLFVAPEAQGTGVGRDLVEHAVTLHGEMTLEVFERNLRARRFYERMGFVERGRRMDEETGHELVALCRPAPLESVAWLCVRDGRVLNVRTKGREVFYLPGGKYEAGETAPQALARELAEELGVVVDADALTEAFTVHDVAHGQNGRPLRMRCFTGGPEDADPVPGREIAEVEWMGRADVDRCAPAYRQVIRRLAAAGVPVA